MLATSDIANNFEFRAEGVDKMKIVQEENSN